METMMWTRQQKNVAIASYLGWTLDAFDFFVMVFVLKDIAATFHSDIKSVAFALTCTLAMRPLGALIFGRLADRFGRRPILMLNVVCFSLFGLLTAFSPNLTSFFIIRALFGIAMGGEWGVGSALTMESIPARSRGFMSGVLQSGYPTGYLFAALVYGLAYEVLGWRGMFAVTAIPAILVFFIRRNVPESPTWERSATVKRESLWGWLLQNWKLTLYFVILMTAFNFFAHGTQDLYPTFLQTEKHFSHKTVSVIAIVYNVGAIIGGLLFGTISERLGRRKAIVVASLIALPVIPLWAFGSTAVVLAIGAFLMQISVQGAWGVMPAHLNEISPAHVRATFPGLVYQLGNLLAASNATLQLSLAQRSDWSLAMSMACVVGVVAVVIPIMITFTHERRGKSIAIEPLDTNPDDPELSPNAHRLV
jgi:SHS family lactate transporter-like MFS transporter